MPISPRSTPRRTRAAKASSPIRAMPRPARCASSMRRSPRQRPLRFFAYAWGEASDLPADTQDGVIAAFKDWGLPVNPLMARPHTAEELIDFYRRNRSRARDARLRHRRRRLQGRTGSTTGAPRLRVAFAALGHRAQVPRRARGDDGAARHRHPGRPHRRADAGREARAGDGRRRRRLQCDAAQRGRDRAQGHPRAAIRSSCSARVTSSRKSAASMLDKRPKDAKPYVFPETCPCAAGGRAREDPKTGTADVVRRCTGGLICAAQAVERLKHFVRAMPSTSRGSATSRSSTFSRRPDQVSRRHFHARRARAARRASTQETRRLWRKFGRNLFAAIDARRTLPLDRFIYALGIRHIGETNARRARPPFRYVRSAALDRTGGARKARKPAPRSTISKGSARSSPKPWPIFSASSTMRRCSMRCSNM